ncbi:MULTISPECIES: hypothetical protein [Methanohalophilus]|jgi:hypothetical protein|uniref:Uncharacterized protein n=1 Tax=Methanohalophilus euhalobius TaxID=51203 RepID=A0A285G6Q2_9EURY|nr:MULTISPECIES: hypothetical protein [Methanohalophilus]TCL12451.1 hypothetical protein C7960_1709 [Methanohalophilus euhalobius]SNY19262.1 hypothetical protein SAMN06295989_10953 [Methanohalophilus euhalobius]
MDVYVISAFCHGNFVCTGRDDSGALMDVVLWLGQDTSSFFVDYALDPVALN